MKGLSNMTIYELVLKHLLSTLDLIEVGQRQEAVVMAKALVARKMIPASIDIRGCVRTGSAAVSHAHEGEYRWYLVDTTLTTGRSFIDSFDLELWRKRFPDECVAIGMTVGGELSQWSTNLPILTSLVEAMRIQSFLALSFTFLGR